MGYTHYWKVSTAFTDEAWNNLKRDALELFANTTIPLADAWGDPGTTPQVDDDAIAFNGVGDDSYETCYITRKSTLLAFCKTNHKPYDSVVVAVLKLARQHNNSVELSSDGGKEVFDE